jgi:hypothetical protein
VIDLARGDPLDDRHVVVRQCVGEWQAVVFEKDSCEEERGPLVAWTRRTVTSGALDAAIDYNGERDQPCASKRAPA